MYLINSWQMRGKLQMNLKVSRREVWWVTFFIPDSVTLCETQILLAYYAFPSPLYSNVFLIISHLRVTFMSFFPHIRPPLSSSRVHDVTIKPIPYTFARDGSMCATRRRLRKKTFVAVLGMKRFECDNRRDSSIT